MMHRPILLSLALALGCASYAQANPLNDSVCQCANAPDAPNSSNQVRVLYAPDPDAPARLASAIRASEAPPAPTIQVIEVTSGMPAPISQGAPPAFSALDTNHDGMISEHEAKAYLLLANDFLYASKGGKAISRAQYVRWASHP